MGGRGPRAAVASGCSSRWYWSADRRRLALGAADSPAGWWLLVALVLSLAGDVALLSDSRARFVLGLGSFLLAHLAFVVAFVHVGMPRGTSALVGLGVVVALAAVVGRRVVPAAAREGGPALGARSRHTWG